LDDKCRASFALLTSSLADDEDEGAGAAAKLTAKKPTKAREERDESDEEKPKPKKPAKPVVASSESEEEKRTYFQTTYGINDSVCC
jgi:hypothetical protein